MLVTLGNFKEVSTSWKVSKLQFFFYLYYGYIFSLITTEYYEKSVNLRIQSENGEIQFRKNPYLDIFHLGFKMKFWNLPEDRHFHIKVSKSF